MKKESKLNDDAIIYTKREEKTEKQKLSEMTFKEKMSYFKDYYLTKVLIIIAALIALTSLLYTVFKEKPEEVLSVAIFDNFFSEEYIAELEEDATAMFVQDTEKQEVFFDTEYYFSSDDYTTAMKLMTRTAAAEIDVIIARQSRFTSQAANDTMLDLTALFSAEEMAEFGDKVLICPLIETDTATLESVYGAEHPFGVILTNMNNFQGYDISADPLVIGVVVNSKNMDNSREFIKHMLTK